MFARITRFEGAPERLDEGVRFALENVIPEARGIEGWRGFLWMADRQSGDGLLVALWEDEAALRASEQQAQRLREHAAAGAHHVIARVDRFEVLAQEFESEPAAAA